MTSTPLNSETPFKIFIPDEELKLLNQKLALVRLSNELEDSGHEYGAPLGDIQRLVGRWKSGYDWRKFERELNEEMPQFKRDILVDGFGTIGIHYVHKKSTVESAIPLLFVHGCMRFCLNRRIQRQVLNFSRARQLYRGSKDTPTFDRFNRRSSNLSRCRSQFAWKWIFRLSSKERLSDFTIRGGMNYSFDGNHDILTGSYIQVGHKLMLALGYDQYGMVAWIGFVCLEHVHLIARVSDSRRRSRVLCAFNDKIQCGQSSQFFL